jgi:hypothetical protein
MMGVTEPSPFSEKALEAAVAEMLPISHRRFHRKTIYNDIYGKFRLIVQFIIY